MTMNNHDHTPEQPPKDVPPEAAADLAPDLAKHDSPAAEEMRAYDPYFGGDEPPKEGTTVRAGEPKDPALPVATEEAVVEALRSVYDPEIPVNIVDLGLVYDCRVVDTESAGKKAEVKMTLTAPGCGMGPTIAADAQGRILTIEDIDDASVEVVWDPPWNQDMISIEGKMKLGML